MPPSLGPRHTPPNKAEARSLTSRTLSTNNSELSCSNQAKSAGHTLLRLARIIVLVMPTVASVGRRRLSRRSTGHAWLRPVQRAFRDLSLRRHGRAGSALGQSKAAIVGCDRGVPVAWYAAPVPAHIFTKVAGLSVPPPFPRTLKVVRRSAPGQQSRSRSLRPGLQDVRLPPRTQLFATSIVTGS
jgi:hypothetical protein